MTTSAGSRKKVAISGYFGFGNTGDEAILTTMLEGLRRAVPDVEIVVVAGNPTLVGSTYQVQAVSHIAIREILAEIETCDLMILGGGGLFQDYWGFDPRTVLTRRHVDISFYSMFPLLATLLEKPLMLYALGIGPLFSEASRYYTRLAFEQAWRATVRDPESKTLLVEAGLDPERVEVTADPAFGLRPSPEEDVRTLLVSEGVSTSADCLVGVAIRNWKIGAETSRWCQDIATALDAFVERHLATVMFVPFQDSARDLTNDSSIAKTICSRMRRGDHATVLRAHSALDTAGILARCDLVLGMRLHSVIFAANGRVPIVGLIYDPKVRSAMRRIGCDEYAVDLSDVTATGVTRLLERAYEKREEIAEQLDGAVKRLAVLVEEDWRRAVSLLEGSDKRRPEPSAEVAGFLKRVTRGLVVRAEDQEEIIARLQAQLAEPGQMVKAPL